MVFAHTTESPGGQMDKANGEATPATNQTGGPEQSGCRPRRPPDWRPTTPEELEPESVRRFDFRVVTKTDIASATVKPLL